MASNQPPLRSVIYYTNWSIYARAHNPQSLPGANLTHILYSFANLSQSTGTVALTDAWSDTDQHYPTDSWNDSGTNIYGCLKQLFLLKKKFRNVKVLLSVGGWTYSPLFKGPATNTEAGRKEFAASVVRLVEDCGFDGVDVDWEYPADEGEAGDYVSLLAAIRAQLDQAQAKRQGGKVKFELSIACPAGKEQYQKLKIKEMDAYLDFWNLMAYDYAGSWGTKAGHQANLFQSRDKPDSTPFDTDAALKYYTGEGGVKPDKMVLGMPLYGRAFENTAGPGETFQGVGEGSWDKGVWDFKVLPKEGAVEFNDTDGVGASWSYDDKTRTMISYDSKEIATAKGQFVRKMGLGGGMWWESSADREGDGSLVKTFVDAIGGTGSLKQCTNCLEYPKSKYDNLKKGFPGEGES